MSRGLMIGAGVAVALGVLAAVLFRPGLEDGDREQRPAGAAEPQQTADNESADIRVTREPYRPPDREAVRSAYARAAQVYEAEGASGLARFGQRCFESLQTGATYRELDFCLAFDAYGAAITQRASGGQPPPSDSYFGQTEARHVRVAEAVMGEEGDASARLVDIRRLAIEVARETGPAIAAARAPAAQPPPSDPSPADEPAPLAQTPAGASEGAATAAPPARTAAAAPPLRLPPPPARQAEREPAAMPTAEEVASARPTGRGPSFNCRSARTRSERLVCEDPALAALDRRLNAAFEDAIASGADRRELRAEQDQWLGTREAAAPDRDAVADAYRRRIGELNRMR